MKSVASIDPNKNRIFLKKQSVHLQPLNLDKSSQKLNEDIMIVQNSMLNLQKDKQLSKQSIKFQADQSKMSGLIKRIPNSRVQIAKQSPHTHVPLKIADPSMKKL